MDINMEKIEKEFKETGHIRVLQSEWIISHVRELELDLTVNASMLARQCDLSREAETKVKELEASNKKMEMWVADLQSGKYINCVYCGHRYAPGTPGIMSQVLYEHIKQCPKHPLSKSEASNKKLREAIKEFRTHCIVPKDISDTLDKALEE